MPLYTVRVVLHGASADHYQQLHERMAKGGASRAIRADDGRLFDLPDGEYSLNNTASCTEVMQAVVQIAAAVKAVPAPSVLVTEAANRAWQLRPVPGQS